MKTQFLFFLFFSTVFLGSCKKDSNSESVDNSQSDNNIVADETWSGVVGIKESIHVKEGATLTIKKGTKIIFLDKDSYLMIEQGAKIIAEGTADSVIVFASTKKSYGSAGGLIINGRAPINSATGDMSEIGSSPYGGNISDDSSGVLKYCRVEFAGVQITAEKEHNGFTFNGVGRGTVVENLQVYKCSDDAFEWFGGNVNCSNLVAYGSEDDLFDWTSGYSGTLTNIYGEYLSDQIGDDRRAIEADNNKNNENETPRSNPSLVNVTFVDNSTTKETKAAFKLRRGTYAFFKNVSVGKFSTVFDIEGDVSLNYFVGSNNYESLKISDYETLVTTKSSEGVSGVNKTEIETAINASIDANATGWDGINQSWVISSDDAAISGIYTSEDDIIKAGGIIK